MIPESVKSIGDDAFFNCHELKTVVISNELDCIGERAFYECKSLVNFYISNGVKEIGVDAFLKSAVYPSELES